MFEVWLQMSDTNIDTENPSASNISDYGVEVSDKILILYYMKQNTHKLPQI